MEGKEERMEEKIRKRQKTIVRKMERKKKQEEFETHNKLTCQRED